MTWHLSNSSLWIPKLSGNYYSAGCLSLLKELDIGYRSVVWYIGMNAVTYSYLKHWLL